MKRKGRIPTDDLIPKNRLCRNQHLMAFQIPSAGTNAYLNSLCSQTIRVYDYFVSTFTSLVRATEYRHKLEKPLNHKMVLLQFTVDGVIEL